LVGDAAVREASRLTVPRERSRRLYDPSSHAGGERRDDADMCVGAERRRGHLGLGLSPSVRSRTRTTDASSQNPRMGPRPFDSRCRERLRLSATPALAG
jgi:hypothetical protein